jgi:hypothetical protein
MVEVSDGGRRQIAGFDPPCMNDQPGNAQDIRHRAAGARLCPAAACIGFIKLS